MIDVTLEKPGEYHFIRSVGDQGVRVGETLYSSSIILTPRQIIEGWGPQRVEDLTEAHLEELFQLEPEVALLGTGPKQAFLSRQLMIRAIERGIGLEVMTTAAACRTYNVLASDGRKVAAALLAVSPDPSGSAVTR